jgi:hypothetical protein
VPSPCAAAAPQNSTSVRPKISLRMRDPCG